MIPLNTIRGAHNCLLCSVVQGRERAAKDELSLLLSRFLELTDTPTNSETTSKSLSTQLYLELEEMRKNKTPQSLREISLDTNCLSAYLLPSDVSANDLANFGTSQVSSGDLIFRFLQRTLPIQFVCHANDFSNLGVQFISTQLKTLFDGSRPMSYRIDFKQRLCKNLNRSDLFSEIDKVIPPGLFVDLSKGQVVIIIEGVKNVLFLSVVMASNSKRFSLVSS
ncbi:hypothetical protein RCL1_006175 [Eukaryota sp. TZLM3-RCL]